MAKPRTEWLIELADVLSYEMHEANLALYLEALAPYSDDEIEDACRAAVRSHQWMPRPGHLVDMIRGKRITATRAAEIDQQREQHQHATRTRNTRGFTRPEGVSVLTYWDQLRSHGLSESEAANKICGG